MNVTQALHRVVLVMGMLTALTASSALTRPRVAVSQPNCPARTPAPRTSATRTV